MARRVNSTEPGEAKNDPMTIVITTGSTHSAGSRKIARAHAAAWSRKKQREEKLKSDAPNSLTSGGKPVNESPHEFAIVSPAASGVTRRTAVLPRHQTKPRRRQGSSSNESALPSPPISPHVGSTDADFEDDPLAPDEADRSISSAAASSHGSCEITSGRPGSSSAIIRRSQNSALTPVLGSAAFIDPFATSEVKIDGNMVTLLRLYTQVILPRIRFHVTISEACSKMTEAHAIKYPSLLYAVLCRASIEPRPEDGDPQDGVRMQQASISRAAKRETIGFKLNAIKHLNRELSNIQVADDHFPLFHAISFLLRIEIMETIHGNVQIVRAHLSGLRQLQTLGISLDKYTYSSLAPVIHTIYFACAMARSPPPFAPPIVDQGHVSQHVRKKLDECPDPELKLTACGFCTHPAIEELGLDFLGLVANRRSYTLFREMSSSDTAWPTPEELEYFTLTEMFVDYRVLLMLSEGNPSSKTQLTPIQESVCLAFLMFGHISSTTFQPASWWSWMQSMTEQLRNALVRSDLSTFWDRNSKLLLWVLFIGAHASHSQLERPWFIAQVTRVIAFLELKGRAETKALLNRFFYLELYFGRHLDALWEEVHVLAQPSDSS